MGSITGFHHRAEAPPATAPIVPLHTCDPWSRGVYLRLAEAEGDIMDKNGLSAFLLGLGVGVGIGMLFAPKSGQETRQYIKDRAGEGSEYLKQRGNEFKENASDWVDRGKEALSRQKDSISDAMEAGKQAYRDAVS